jgi:lipopolysaccharide biosynthesis regulator YciM
MATRSNLLSRVPDILETNARLSMELGKLETRRTELEQQFKAHIALLNVAMSYLPAVVNSLLIEDHPVRPLKVNYGMSEC